MTPSQASCLSIGTVNTYWLRIRMKAGGSARTETVARIIKERAESSLREANVERRDMAAMLVQKEQELLDLRATLALLNHAMDHIQSTVWATDPKLVIQVIANGAFPATHFGVLWESGKTVQQIFKTKDPTHPAIAAHLRALKGEESVLALTGEFSRLSLHVVPLTEEHDIGQVIGCIGILNSIG
jgi:hypothetical protein